MKQNIFILILFIHLFNNNLTGQNNAEAEIRGIAIQSINQYLNKIPAGKEANYGFNNREEFSLAKAGKIYQVYTLNTAFFLDSVLTGQNYLTSTGEWRLSITVNNEARALLSFVFRDKQWQAVDFGAAELAKDINNKESIALIKKYNNNLLRVYQLNCDFLINGDITTKKNLKLYFLKSAETIINLKKSSNDYYDLDHILKTIKEKLN